jgi:LmbE family N-acetylglucosaminyl deacetylase
VIGLGDKTPLASPDHAQAVAITEAAVFYSRLTKWDDTFDGLPVHTVPNFLTYFLFAGLPQVPHGHWPLVVNISSQLECKLESIACYKSQFPAEKAHVFPRVRAMAATVGMLTFLGADTLVEAHLADGTPMRALVRGPLEGIAPGASIKLSWEKAREWVLTE